MTPRRTRLLRAPDLGAFRHALVAEVTRVDPLDLRSMAILVPTRAAAGALRRTLEDAALGVGHALVMPDLVTRDEFYARLHAMLPGAPRLLTAFDREALVGAAARAASGAGFVPPFRLRPGLIVEILALYDALRRQHKTVDDFERLLVEHLEGATGYDRGADRMLRQTRFLVATFREYEARVRASDGVDEHTLCTRARLEPSPAPIRHVIVTTGDRQSDTEGLWLADFDLLSRLPGLERLDVVTTEAMLATGLHERVHSLLPGIEEVRVVAPERPLPVLVAPRGEAACFLSRDREEELVAVARRLKASARAHPERPLAREAIVFRRPLPYVYLAQTVFDAAGVPFECQDALPLASEPYAAALDIVFTFVRSACSRAATVALLRSPHFVFEDEDGWIGPGIVAALDRALGEAGYLGGPDQLARLAEAWRTEPDEAHSRRRQGRRAMAARAARVATRLAAQLAPLRDTAPVATHLDALLRFLRTHDRLPSADDPLRSRHLRARAAIHAALTSLGEAAARYDAEPVALDELASSIRRWIEAQTFAPRAGAGGVQLLDRQAARYAEIDGMQIVGMVEGEWPDRPRRNIFYSPGLLGRLDWPSDKDRLASERAAFDDLLRSAARRVSVSTFTLEDDALVEPSSLLDQVPAAGLVVEREASPATARIFRHEALASEPLVTKVLPADIMRAADLRVLQAAREPNPGRTAAHHAPMFALTALERYLECPYRFFAADVLRLEEPPEDEPTLSPRARGRFIHEVFQAFYEEWQGRGRQTVTAEHLDDARALFRDVAEPRLARLPEAEAAIERTRLFGSAVAVGLADVVFGMEAERDREVVERLLEYPLEGEFALGGESGRTASLKGIADRIDLLADGTLRVIDYKSGRAPNAKRALQVPIYGLCAEERLAGRHGRTWHVGEAAYIAFTGKRTVLSIVKPGDDNARAVLDDARERLFQALDGITAGVFPPRPVDKTICGYCAFAHVCRKEYVDAEAD